MMPLSMPNSPGTGDLSPTIFRSSLWVEGYMYSLYNCFPMVGVSLDKSKYLINYFTFIVSTCGAPYGKVQIFSCVPLLLFTQERLSGPFFHGHFTFSCLRSGCVLYSLGHLHRTSYIIT